MKSKIYFDGAYYYKNDLLKIIEVTNSNGGGNAGLYLAVTRKDDRPSYSLFKDLNQPDDFLATHKIFSTSYINGLTITNKCFAPLLNSIAETHQNGHELKYETLTLLVFYYLTESAVSVSFIALWLVFAGYTEAFAGELAMAVYVARTERTDCDDVFDIRAKGNPSQTHNHALLLNVASKANYFQSVYQQNHYFLVYDDFAAFESLSSGSDLSILNCQDIPETAFMVEDHHHVILGLSLKLCEALALCEFSAPPFYEFIMKKCSFAETTYLGLGYFINKYTSEIVKMLYDKGLKMSMRAMDVHHHISPFTLEKGVSFFSSQTSDQTFLPIFLDIEKP